MQNTQFNIEGPVIDLALGAKIMGADQDTAKKMISIMLDSAATEIKRLEAAHAEKNWELVREVVHKLRGGVAYCGTPRLQQACNYLEDSLIAKNTEHLEELYQYVLNELKQVQVQHTP